MAKFFRQGVHAVGGHVRRIAQNHIKALPAKILKQIAFYQRNVLLKTMFRDVATRDFKRVSGDVARRDVGLWKRMCGKDRDTARACTQIKHRINLIGISDEVRQPLVKQLANE